MSIKIEEGKFYRTESDKKVGPARFVKKWKYVNDIEPTNEWAWARFLSNGNVLEVVGLTPQESCNDKPIAEWTDTPTLWRDMTPEEKGALLLAEHEGKVIEILGYSWNECIKPTFDEEYAYRVKPEPKRETVTMPVHYSAMLEFWVGSENTTPLDTHRITFETIDGEPNTTSIKMEKL